MSNPDPSLGPCLSEKSDSKITVKANGKKATFDNSARSVIKIVDVDCWTPASDGLKADYIVAKPGVVDVIVELKGQDTEHAAKQILSTLAEWKKAPPFSASFGGLIVFTRCPQNSATISDIKARFLEKHGLWLEMNKNSQTEYQFEKFLFRNK
jgi:hypothetical protein